MKRPDPPFECADDLRWHIVPAPDWRPVSGKRCRHQSADGKHRGGRTRCPNEAVAELNRRRRTRHGYADCWWAYCADHMWGGKYAVWIENDRVVHWELKEVCANEAGATS